jgi:predicted naringenin-chalcone synthase
VSKPSILAIGTSLPDGTLSQDDAAGHAASVSRDPGAARGIRALYRRAGVVARRTVLGSGPTDPACFYPLEDARGPTTARRGDVYRARAGPLASAACAQALQRAEVLPESITHLVTASCTGFDAPGPDQRVIAELGLSPAVRRTHIGFMGCHAAINALAVASAFAAGDPSARVLVCCVELCTLHFAYQADAERHVANALFGDGAAAAVVGLSAGRGPRIAQTASVLIPDSGELMSWSIGDHGYEMRLDPTVPDVLARSVPGWLDGWLGEAGLVRDAVRSWAIHPGGPRVLGSLRDAFGLDDGEVAHSRAVLTEHGNLSSATVLCIIDRMLRAGAGTPLVAMAFGPGLAGEGLLLTDG